MKRKRIEVPLVDGGTAWLDRLTPRMMIAVGDAIWCARRDRLIADMAKAEIDSPAKMEGLKQLDSERGLMSELLRYAVTLEGATAIIEKAAASDTAENATGLPDSASLEGEGVIRTALALVGADIGADDDLSLIHI